MSLVDSLPTFLESDHCDCRSRYSVVPKAEAGVG